MSKKALVIPLMLLVLVASLVYLWRKSPGAGGEEVLVLCGGTMRDPMEAVIQRYQKATGGRVLATYGDSGDLCVQIQKTGKGDIYLCHDPFMPWAQEQGLIATWDTVGYLDNAIIVPKGNPKGIRGLKDLARPGVRLGIGDRRYSTSGVMVKDMLDKLDYGQAVLKNVVAESKGHQQRCTDVAMGTLDAAIVWKAAAHPFRDRLDIIPISSQSADAITSATYKLSDLRNVKVTVGITTQARDKPAARRFYEFVTTRCRDIFEQNGFRMEKQ